MSGISLDDPLAAPSDTPGGVDRPAGSNATPNPAGSSDSSSTRNPTASQSTTTITNSRTVTETPADTSPSSSPSSIDEDSSSSPSTSTRSSTTTTTMNSPSSSSTSSLTDTTDISSLTDTDTDTSTTSSDTTSSTTSESSTKKAEPSTTTSTTTKHSSTSDEVPSITASPPPKNDKDDGKLGTGTIIGISLAGFAVIGILLVVLGTFLKVRRKRIIEKQTAHLKRASEIWDFADSNHGSSDIDAANEKAASERGGAAPFAPRKPPTQPSHSRQESADSQASEDDRGSEHSHPPRPQQATRMNPYDRNMAQQMPSVQAPSMLPYMQPMQRVANRLSNLMYPGMGMARSAPQPPPRDIEYGPQQPMRPAMGREDSFGARAHQAPVLRNMFFPPPQPMALPGASI